MEEQEKEASAVCQEAQSVSEERSPISVREDTSTAVIVQEKKEQDRSEVAASTGRKRALPAWLSDIRVETKTTASKVVSKPASKKPNTVDREHPSSAAAAEEASRKPTSDQKAVEVASPESPSPDATGRRPAEGQQRPNHSPVCHITLTCRGCTIR